MKKLMLILIAVLSLNVMPVSADKNGSRGPARKNFVIKKNVPVNPKKNPVPATKPTETPTGDAVLVDIPTADTPDAPTDTGKKPGLSISSLVGNLLTSPFRATRWIARKILNNKRNIALGIAAVIAYRYGQNPLVDYKSPVYQDGTVSCTVVLRNPLNTSLMHHEAGALQSAASAYAQSTYQSGMATYQSYFNDGGLVARQIPATAPYDQARAEHEAKAKARAERKNARTKAIEEALRIQTAQKAAAKAKAEKEAADAIILAQQEKLAQKLALEAEIALQAKDTHAHEIPTQQSAPSVPTSSRPQSLAATEPTEDVIDLDAIQAAEDAQHIASLTSALASSNEPTSATAHTISHNIALAQSTADANQSLVEQQAAAKSNAEQEAIAVQSRTSASQAKTRHIAHRIKAQREAAAKQRAKEEADKAQFQASVKEEVAKQEAEKERVERERAVRAEYARKRLIMKERGAALAELDRQNVLAKKLAAAKAAEEEAANRSIWRKIYDAMIGA